MRKVFLIFVIAITTMCYMGDAKSEDGKIAEFNAEQKELYERLTHNVSDGNVITEMRNHVMTELQMEIYKKLKTEGKDEEYVKSWRDEIIWSKGNKNERKKLLPELVENIRSRIKNDNFPYKEGEDYTFGRLASLEEYPEVIELYCEIIEGCKNSEGVIDAIYGLRNVEKRNIIPDRLKSKVLKTLKKALMHKAMGVRVKSASILVKYYREEKELLLPVLIEIASLENLDLLNNEFQVYQERIRIEKDPNMAGHWKEQLLIRKQGIVLEALDLLSHYEDDVARKTIHEVSREGANEKIKYKAEELLKKYEK